MNTPHIPGQQMQEQGPTLTVERAHNALVAVTEMYAGALADLRRENAMLKGQMEEAHKYLLAVVVERNGLGDALKKLREERSAERVAQVVETRVSTPPENGGM